MAHEALPIDSARFASALEDLPVDALHSKAAELRNSMAHLKYSNEQMVPFADQGDQDCKDAMYENLIVISRMNQRIDLLRAEVERRGMRWADAEVEERGATASNEALVNGDSAHNDSVSLDRSTATQGSTVTSGRLTDAELAARLQEMVSEQGGDDDDDQEGVHL